MADGCEYLTGQTIAIDGAQYITGGGTFSMMSSLRMKIGKPSKAQ